jgi:hypothetical protein
MRHRSSYRAVAARILLVGLSAGCAGGGSTRDGSPGERAEFTGHHGNGFAQPGDTRGQPPVANPDAGGPSASSFFGGVLGSLLGGSD